MEFNQPPMPDNQGFMPPQPPPPPQPKIPVRNIGLCILFSIITCGIYTYYWLFCLNEDLRALTGNPYSSSGGMVILFSILTCGIYLFYWVYKQGESIDVMKRQIGRPAGGLGILYLVITILGFGIVAYALMQNEINTFVREY